MTFDTPQSLEGPATARSFILVTPDGERTMNTFLGACQGLGPDDIDAETVASANITYLEGYLWDPAEAKIAFRKAAALAHQNERRVAITLSDSFCVDRYRDEFRDLLRTRQVDILFANEHELKSLYATSDFDTAVAALREEGALGVVTRSEQGSLVVTPDAIKAVPAGSIEKLVDTTGAGDLYAAGFLFGLARGIDHETCARLGGLAAAEIIQHIGARPETSLSEHVRQSGIMISELV